MKLLTITLAAYGASVALALSPLGHVSAQTEMAPAPPPAPAGHGNWTLKQREDWLNDRLERARADGSLHEDEYDRAKQDMAELQHQEYTMREAGQGQLTDNQTADLEARLDAMAAKIHWANMATYARPW